MGAKENDSDEDEEWQEEKIKRSRGCCSVLVVVPNVTAEIETCVVAFVSAYGDPVDMRVLFKNFYQPPNANYLPEIGTALHARLVKRLEHRNLFMNLVKRYKPAVILLPVCDTSADQMMKHITSMLDEDDVAEQFKVKPCVLYCNASVPRAVAYHPRVMQEGVYRDCESPLQRVAISAARLLQNPLAETCQLWHELPEENGLLRLHLHRLQNAVKPDTLSAALMRPLVEAVACVGVDVNQVRRSSHLQSLVPFVPGLGPRKARLFKQCLSNAVRSRKDFAVSFARHLHVADEEPLKSPIITNCLPFLKICPDPRDEWSIEQTPGFDRTRLAEPFRPWLNALCQEALKHANKSMDDEIDSDQLRDVVSTAVEAHRMHGNMARTINELSFKDWPEMAGNPDYPAEYANFDALMDILTPEIIEPYKDKRAEFEEMDGSRAILLMLGESEDSFKIGSVVHTSVQKDLEFPEEGREKKSLVNVFLLPSRVKGAFHKFANKGQERYIEGCDMQFDKNASVLARVASLPLPGRTIISLSVDADSDLWARQFPLSDTDFKYFVPHPSENWTNIKLGLAQKTEAQAKESLKDYVKRPRNIRHTNWLDSDHQRAVQTIEAYPMGNVLFRPSRRHDIIIAMLKVRLTEGETGTDPERCFRVFDVLEIKSKSVSCGCELAEQLEVDDQRYQDFDEIIARHMDPIMENLRHLQEHDQYGFYHITDKGSLG